MLNIKVTILLKLRSWVMRTFYIMFCNPVKGREPNKGWYKKLHEQKNADGNQQTTDSFFHLQSLKYISCHQSKKHQVLSRAVCWNSTYLPLAVIDLFFTYKQ